MAGARDATEEIRSRTNVLDVVSEHVTLKRAGKGYKGLCPFHSEKTPSFTVSEEFQTWHCFGCGEHGDIFSFLMKIDNLTFSEARERLARRAGVELEQFQDRRSTGRELLAEINALACEYFIKHLTRSPAILEYLRGRGLADQTIDQFKLGYAPQSWDGLVAYLSKEGIKIDDAARAGLIRQGDRGHYDLFRHRVIFPILDIQERIVGFGGRALGDDQPKYLNSPETPLFAKNRLLYGLNFARRKIAEDGYAVLVEGYTDVTASHQAGFTNCVATLGTALTPEHIKLLSRYAGRVVLAYDADSAGMKAALRSAAMFEEMESDVRIARLPGGDDPDSLLRKGRSADFTSAVSGALPVTDYKLAILMERHDLSVPAERASMLKEAARLLLEVRTHAERERFIRELARYHPNFETGTTRAEDHIRRDVDALIRKKRGFSQAENRTLNVSGPPAAQERAENMVLRALITGDAAERILEALIPEDFSSETRQKAAELLLEMFREKKGIYLPEILETADPGVGRFLSELAMRDEAEPVTEVVLNDCIARIKNWKLKRLRTSDILAPYITKDGIIDPSNWPRGQTSEEWEEFLRKSGRKPGAHE